MKNPSLIHADQLRGNWPQAGSSDGRWCASRPLGYRSLRRRIALAWGVFIGRYDALKWEQQ